MSMNYKSEIRDDVIYRRMNAIGKAVFGCFCNVHRLGRTPPKKIVIKCA